MRLRNEQIVLQIYLGKLRNCGGNADLAFWATVCVTVIQTSSTHDIIMYILTNILPTWVHYDELCCPYCKLVNFMLGYIFEYTPLGE